MRERRCWFIKREMMIVQRKDALVICRIAFVTKKEETYMTMYKMLVKDVSFVLSSYVTNFI